jgi:hypothetical protein
MVLQLQNPRMTSLPRLEGSGGTVPLRNAQGQEIGQQPKFSQDRYGNIIDNETGEAIQSSQIINESNRLGGSVNTLLNPEGDPRFGFQFDPRGFNLENFGVGQDISGQIGNIQGGAASQSINDILTGNAPSLAQLQLEDATEKNLSNISSLVNTQRGNPLAFRQGLRSGEESQRGLGRDSSILRAQETLNAINASQGQNKLVSDLVQLGIQERFAKRDGAIDFQKTQSAELLAREQLRQKANAEKLGIKDFIGPLTSGLGDLGAGISTIKDMFTSKKKG